MLRRGAVVLVLGAGAAWIGLVSAAGISYGHATGIRVDEAVSWDVSSFGGDAGLTVTEYTPGRDVRMTVAIVNDARVPVTLTDVWPDDTTLECGWGPTHRQLYLDPVRRGSDGPTRPVPGYRMAPGEEVWVQLTGPIRDHGGCIIEGLQIVEDVEVRTRVLGIARSHEVPLQQQFGLSDIPRRMLRQIVTRNEPTPLAP
jgi:hypothetical protein